MCAKWPHCLHVKVLNQYQSPAKCCTWDGTQRDVTHNACLEKLQFITEEKRINDKIIIQCRLRGVLTEDPGDMVWERERRMTV